MADRRTDGLRHSRKNRFIICPMICYNPSGVAKNYVYRGADPSAGGARVETPQACWGASWASPVGSGAKPRPQTHFLHILGHRTLLVERKNHFQLSSAT